MNRLRRRFNRRPNRDHESISSPTPPVSQSEFTRPSTPPTQSWTTHDSNLALLSCLSTATPTRPALPTEVILQILEDPTRWIHLDSVSRPRLADRDRPICNVGDNPVGVPVLWTRPFSASEVRLLRKVVLAFRSCDQGWSSQLDQVSYSWFDANLARVPAAEGDEVAPEEEGGQGNGVDVETSSHDWTRKWIAENGENRESHPRYRIQANRFAESTPEDYSIELTDEHEMVQRIQGGDRIVLWACACYPGWENRVYEAKISVLGVDDLLVKDA